MTEFNREFWLNIIKTEMKQCPVPGSLQQCSSTCTNTNSKTRKGQQGFPIHIISGVAAALSNAKTHSPVP